MNNRLKNLSLQMTIEEKLNLLSGKDLWHTVPIEHLGIPSMKVTDGPNGARGAHGDLGPKSVCVPVGVALGATWNPELIFRVGQVLGEETKIKGAHILLAPTVNIHRSPLAGRNFECYSEDPYLTGQMAIAYIKGVQSQGIGACIKHFVCNDSEFERHTISSEISERPLREIYLEPFRMALREAKPWAVMSAYNKINGIYASENPYTLLDILKGEFGFDGVVISDWYGTYSEAAAQGGLDLEMPGPGKWMIVDYLLPLIKSGEITMEVINDKILRLLLTMERVGLLDNPETQQEDTIDKPEHRKIALEAALESIVLLKNENNILPLDVKKLNSIAVIGANAKYPPIMGGGSSRVTPLYKISPLEAIKKQADDSIDIQYSIGCPIHRDLPPIEFDWLTQSNSNEIGLTVDIFDNLELEGEPVNSFTIDRPRISWSEELISPADPRKYSARLSGCFMPDKTGEYTFSLEGNGISRLSINEEIVVDNWHMAPPEITYWSSGQNTGNFLWKFEQRVQFVIEISSNNPTPWRSLKIGCLPPLSEDPISDAVKLAKISDAVVLFAGTTDEWESEGFDRNDMGLPGEQSKLIESILAVNQNTVLVLNTGAPIKMPWLDKTPAVLQSWFGGQELGNAIASIVFGQTNPSGKLPTTFPKRLRDNPAYINYPGENGKVHYGEGIFVGYRYYDCKDIIPLFPFGHGLSYTTFEYSNLRLNSTEFFPGDDIQVFLDITNVGNKPGKETVQLYIKDFESTLIRPEKELKGFVKIYLEPGETKTVTLSLSEESLAYYDPGTKSWTSEDGDFELLIGSSSRDIRLKSSFTWKGESLLKFDNDSNQYIEIPLRILLQEENSKEVLETHLGQLLSHPNFDQAKKMSLVDLAIHLPEFLTKEKLSEIEKNLVEVLSSTTER
jgi:beta-glucosidase